MAGNKISLKRAKKFTRAVSDLQPKYASLTDSELRQQTDVFRSRLDSGEVLDDLAIEAFALVREASLRVLGLFQHDVQIIGGFALHQGAVAQMNTGEGKTLAAVAPAYLNALSGRGVHVVTVNDYLAERDSHKMGRVFSFLGLTTGAVLSSMSPSERHQSYQADVCYGTANEFGFDYLRDNMAHSADARVQRSHVFAIIDEVDSILIDEARTPLIISQGAGAVDLGFSRAAAIARKMQDQEHYIVDWKKNLVSFTEEGITFIEAELEVDNLYGEEGISMIGHLKTALQAKELFIRDIKYIVDDEGVSIVDEHTGRIMDGRRFGDGLHQAIEAKEGLEVHPENRTLAVVTLQNYFRMYEKLSGMTGTAVQVAPEFLDAYGLTTIQVPPHRKLIRVDHPDRMFESMEKKFAAVTELIIEAHKKGQPVLVGTASVESSELVSRLLQSKGIKHKVLNAKKPEDEARIIETAGLLGAITVATNMAGRGSDIILGGDPESRAEHALEDMGLEETDDLSAYREAYLVELEKQKVLVVEETRDVIRRGGLLVVGTERHESRRIDDQLRGRAGRQGDPGASVFFLSLEDHILRAFNEEGADKLFGKGESEDGSIAGRQFTKVIADAQAIVGEIHGKIRSENLKYDDVIAKQRTRFYLDRAELVDDKADPAVNAFAMVPKIVHDSLGEYLRKTNPSFWSAEEALVATGAPFSAFVDVEEIEDITRTHGDKKSAAIVQDLMISRILDVLVRFKETLTEQDQDRFLFRACILEHMDQMWSDHLVDMSHLRTNVSLRAFSQQDPLSEYQSEGYKLYWRNVRSMERKIVEALVFEALAIDAETTDLVEL